MQLKALVSRYFTKKYIGFFLIQLKIKVIRCKSVIPKELPKN